MSRHVSFPKEPKPKWRLKSDVELIAHFRKELETRSGLTPAEWDAYNGAWKRTDPKGYEKYRSEAGKRIDMRNAKDRLTIEELEQIIAEKKAENSDNATKGPTTWERL